MAAWMSLRPIVSQTPRPELRSGWALEEKDHAHQEQRRAEAAHPVMLVP